MRYKCLILDHDDTVVDSTRGIHYPAFLAALAAMRPYHGYVSLEDYFRLNFRPGFLEYCENSLHLTAEEVDREYEIWQSFVRERIPRCFPGVRQIIREQKAEGGLVCVVSHSVD
ncbi:MAG: HAD family hydrolase, partial [Clostridia bacterium]|nr:HAD family hydrolase [Clostridia bacterium]